MSLDVQARLEVWQQRQAQSLASFAPVTMRGRIQRVNGMLLQCRLPQARIGDLCQVEKSPGDYMLAEIIGFDQQDAVLSALGNLEAIKPLRAFMLRNVDPDVLTHLLENTARLWPAQMAQEVQREDLILLIPAFVLSQLQAGFEIGFLIYIPFIVIDLIVSNLLLALGMQMVSPMTISLPLKLLLFVLVSGWSRLLDSLFLSYL